MFVFITFISFYFFNITKNNFKVLRNPFNKMFTNIKLTETRDSLSAKKSSSTFCKTFSDTWCTKCISTIPDYECVWCHSTKECGPGNISGFYFGSCDSYSYYADDKCTGKISKTAIISIRIVLAIIIAVFIVGWIFLLFQKTKEETTGIVFEEIQ